MSKLKTVTTLNRKDPDETEGRKLYRTIAEAQAHRDLALTKRKVKLND